MKDFRVSTYDAFPNDQCFLALRNAKDLDHPVCFNGILASAERTSLEKMLKISLKIFISFLKILVQEFFKKAQLLNSAVAHFP